MVEKSQYQKNDYSKFTDEDYLALEDPFEMMEAFKQMFTARTNKLADQLAENLPPTFKAISEYKNMPKTVDATGAAQYLIGKKNVLILTGAGLSAASGIPTFRGSSSSGAFWSDPQIKYAGVDDPCQILTQTFFNSNPLAVWQWHWDFIKLQKKGKPNVGHQSIAQFQEFCYQNKDKVNTMLVTQNIDDYHSQMVMKSKVLPTKQENCFTPNVYEIHGNVKYMHCSDEDQEHSKILYPAPGEQQSVPKCETCGKVMKPHCMFFDEAYNEHYYRTTSVQQYVDSQVDCCLLIGTALQTQMAKSIIIKLLDKQTVPVIEMNLDQSAIPGPMNGGVGHLIRVKEKAEEALPKLFQQYYKLVGQDN